MSDRQELVLLLREIMRWEKRTLQRVRGDDYLNGEITIIGQPRADGGDAWDDLADILNRAHVAISTDSRKRTRQRPQGRC